MKFHCENEMEQISFEGSQITDLNVDGDIIKFTFNNALIKAGNSQNGRFEDMICAVTILRLQGAVISRIVKEGLKHYDADGRLTKEIPDEDVPAPAQSGVLERCREGQIFTVVPVPMENGFGYEFGIDVPQVEDDEETDTFWLCVTCQKTEVNWDRYCSPADD